MSSLEARLRRAATLAKADPAAPLMADPVNIVDFAGNHCGQDLYPRQGTLLKLLALDVDALTSYDYGVIRELEAGFTPRVEDGRLSWVGVRGCAPGLVDRMRRQRATGAPWFNEVVLVLGRRASKGYTIRTLLAWALWRLLHMPDPPKHYEIDRDKDLNFLIFSTKLDQAKRDQFGDIRDLLLTAPCFRPYLGRSTTSMVSLLTRPQLDAGYRPGLDQGNIVVSAAETTESAGRGAAIPGFVQDEVAHVVGAGSTADANAIYRATTPAVAPFRQDRLIILSSSPAEKTGPQYAAYQRSLQIDPTTGMAANPHIFMVQGPSDLLYGDWQHAGELPMWPGGPNYRAKTRAVLELTDAEVVATKEVDPEGHAVEYLGQFRSARNAYLPLATVTRIFDPLPNGRTLEPATAGVLGYSYMAHADPSVSGANFGFAVAHLEPVEGRQHVIFDFVHVWQPKDFPDGRIHYPTVENEIDVFAAQFGLSRLSFDQYNSAMAIQRLDERINGRRPPKRCHVLEVTPSHSHNWKVAELFKTAAGLGLVHAPAHTLARLELEYLQRERQRVFPPTTGPVRTSDIADAMFEVTYALLEDGAPDLFARLGGGLRATRQVIRPTPPPAVAPPPATPHELMSRRKNGNGASRRGGGNPAQFPGRRLGDRRR